VPDPCRVDDEAAGLGVLAEALGEARRDRVGHRHDGAAVVRDDDPEDTAEEGPGLLEPLDHGLEGLAEGQPDERVAAVRRGEHEAVHDAPVADGRIGQESQAAEVDLQLVARLPVGDPDGRRPATDAELVGAEPVERPVRDDAPLAGEQGLDLGEPQTVLEPGGELRPALLERCPRPAVAAGSGRADALADRPDERVVEGADPGCRVEARVPRRLQIAAHGLAIDPCEPRDLAQAAAQGRQPQDLPYLGHCHLPKRHTAPPVPWTPGAAYHSRRVSCRGGPMSGEEVVP